MKLATASCLDLNRIASPWAIDTDHQARMMTSGVPLTVDPKSVGLAAYERPGFKTTFDGIAQDGKLRVGVSGWSVPPAVWSGWRVASPARIDENIRTGWFRPQALWPSDQGLEAYRSGGEWEYFDRRRLTQCRDYNFRETPLKGGPDIALCKVVSRAKDFSFYLELDSRHIERLPQALRLIERAIEHTRRKC